MKFNSETTHHLSVQAELGELPCDPNDINAWTSVTYRLGEMTGSTVFEDMEHYGTSPERDYKPGDTVNLSFAFSIYDTQNPRMEIERNIDKVYAALQATGFRMPNIGGPFRVEFVTFGGDPVDINLMRLPTEYLTEELSKWQEADATVQSILDVPWRQDIHGNLYINPADIVDHKTQVLVVRNEPIDVRSFNERRIAVMAIQRNRQMYDKEKGFFVGGPYNAGTTPADVILAAFGNEKFSMDLVGGDAKAMTDVVNQGIDSYLEGIVDSSFTRRGQRLECSVSRKDILVILRRLWEMYENGDDHAGQFRSTILDELGIEEV